jgi:hypothetical protein
LVASELVAAPRPGKARRLIAAVRRLPRRFWAWYERNYALNVGIAAALFALQIVHLIWLTFDVVVLRLSGESLLPLGGLFRGLVVVVDYTEIPALIGTSLIYLNDLRKGWNPRSFLFLLFLNSQWLHIFWITDEFVVGEFGGEGGGLPTWLAWVAIAIDYLELPVIVDTFRRFGASVRRGTVGTFLREGLE